MTPKLPGYLHFNLRRGCQSEMINAAMANFIDDRCALDKVFKALGLGEIEFNISKHISHGLLGAKIDFYLSNIQINKNSKFFIKKPKKRSKLEPVWDRGDDAKNSLSPKPEFVIPVDFVAKNAFVQACINNNNIYLAEIKQFFTQTKTHPVLSALAVKILENLGSHSVKDQRFSGQEALWLLCHLVMMCAAIEILDPKFISATKIYLGLSILNILDETIINEILIGLPSIESEDDIAVDALAIAFIKTLVGHFGVRGDSVILASSIGLSSTIDAINPGQVMALWCEARLPDSISETGPSNKARVSFLYEACGLVKANSDMQSLNFSLFKCGAKSLHYSLVYDEKSIGYYLVRFLVSDEEKHEAIEVFLLKCGARDVGLREIEQHELNKRLVNVPMGSGNKIYSYRFYEYIYLDKVARVEPLAEDLHDYILKTDYSFDVARADMLSAWKKWRGK